MPDLPTITVTQAQADILLSVFPGATTAEKVAAYRKWLRQELIAHVKDVRREQVLADEDARVQEAEQKTDQEIGNI